MLIRRVASTCQIFYFRKLAGSVDTDTDDERSSTFIIHPDLRNVPKKFRIPPELAIGEAVGLVEAVSSWKVAGEHIEILKRPHVKYLFGETTSSRVDLVGKEQKC